VYVVRDKRIWRQSRVYVECSSTVNVVRDRKNGATVGFMYIVAVLCM